MTTAWRHVEFDGTTPPWTLREVAGRGLCAFATRSFAAGELICTERPTVWVLGHHPFSSEQVVEIDVRVERLDAADRAALLDMCNAFPEAPSAAAGIFQTNSFDMTDSPHGQACAMYCALARLNHSCVPNAQQTHLPDTGEEVLHASRAISAGEEINDCYIELRQGTEQRRAALRETYRFECHCAACGTGEKDEEEEERRLDDARRERAALLDDAILTAATEQSPAAALELAFEAVRLLASPACAPWSARYLPDAYCTIHQLASVVGLRDLAREHIALAYRINCQLQGPRAPVSLSLREKL